MGLAAVSVRRKLRNDALGGSCRIPNRPRHHLQRYWTAVDGAELSGAGVLAGERHAVRLERSDVHGHRLLSPQTLARTSVGDGQASGGSRRSVRAAAAGGAVV